MLFRMKVRRGEESPMCDIGLRKAFTKIRLENLKKKFKIIIVIPHIKNKGSKVVLKTFKMSGLLVETKLAK